MKKAVSYVSFQSSIKGPVLGGNTSLTDDGSKFKGIEMWTGIEAGFVTIYYKGHELGVPMMNVTNVNWKEELGKNRLSA